MTRDINIRELRVNLSKDMLRRPFRVISRNEVLGTWHPGELSKAVVLESCISRLNSAINVLTNIPYGIKQEKLEEGEKCEKCGGVEELTTEWDSGEEHVVCRYCLGLKKRK